MSYLVFAQMELSISGALQGGIKKEQVCKAGSGGRKIIKIRALVFLVGLAAAGLK